MSALRKPYHRNPRGKSYCHQNALNQNRKIICTNANNIFEIIKEGCVHIFEGQCQKIIMVGFKSANLCRVYILTVQQNSTNVPMNVAGSIEAYAGSWSLAIV